MKHSRHLFCFVIAILLIGSFTTSSWAWRGGWGWRGPRVGVYLGPGPYGWYDPDYYDPYYYAPGYPYPYAYGQAYPGYPVPAYATPQTSAQPSQTITPDNSRNDLKYINSQIVLARHSVNFQFEDGDIGADQKEEALRQIDAVEKEARAEAAANGGKITGDQERELLQALRGGNLPLSTPEKSEPSLNANPSLPHMTPAPGTPLASGDQPRHDLKAVSEQIARLHTILDKKLSNGDITQTQHDAESDYLNQLDKVAQAQARANSGKLSDNQQNSLQDELLRVDAAVQRNLVIH